MSSFEAYSSVETDIALGSSAEATAHRPNLLGRVSLVVTSPPYHNAISYESHAVDARENYRIREQGDYYGQYLPFLGSVWNQCWLMLRPGGHLAINVGSVLEGGEHFALPQDIQHQILRSGLKWQFVKNIIWHKVTAGVKRAGSVIQHQLPGYWYPNIMTEHIVVFRKPGPYSLYRAGTPSEWWEDVWDLAPVPPRTVAHPAPFPEDLPHRLIRMLTRKGEWVMDPFNGSGATTKAAHDLGRHSLGFDVEPRYIKIARDRLSEPSAVRNKQLTINPVDVSNFSPGKPKGPTRHGSGLGSRRKSRG